MEGVGPGGEGGDAGEGDRGQGFASHVRVDQGNHGSIFSAATVESRGGWGKGWGGGRGGEGLRGRGLPLIRR